jgi:hypothetical protein
MTEKERTEQLRGCMDCKAGLPENPNGSKYYRDGYGLQYEWEQMLTANNIKQETIH